MSGLSAKLQPVFDGIKARNSNEPEFLQAAEEILHSLGPVVEAEGGDKYIPGTNGVLVFPLSLTVNIRWLCICFLVCSASTVGMFLVWVSSARLAPAPATIVAD